MLVPTIGGELGIHMVKYHEGNRMNDRSSAKEILSQWLIGSYFNSFNFGGNFALFFNQPEETKYGDRVLPKDFELFILEDWWIGNRQVWDKKIAELGSGVQPDEPVKAYELAKLRWSEGAQVRRFSLTDDVCEIEFYNGFIICISVTGEDDFCFKANEASFVKELPKFNFQFDRNGLFMDILD